MGAPLAGGGSGGGAAPGGGSALGRLGARSGGGNGGALSDINVTPFVDVVLVLLIIFMVTAPLLVRSLDVNLPTARLRSAEATERIIVTVDSEGRTFVGETAVNPVLLGDRLREIVEFRGAREGYLQGDASLEYGQVIEVLDTMKRAGFDRVGLVYAYPGEQRGR